MDIFIRKCPICNIDVSYKTKKNFLSAEKRNSKCKSCAAKENYNAIKLFKLKCYNCTDKDVFFKTESGMNHAINNNKVLCKSCKMKLSNSIPTNFMRKCPDCKKELYYKNKKCLIDANNKNKKCLQCRSKKENNPMFGKNLFDMWIDKYGIEEAVRRKENHAKRSACNGEKNGMFGKVPSRGVGRGWGGYYKNHYFRSLMELHYLIFLVENNIRFESAENVIFKVEYMYKDKIHNYFPDFYLIDTNEIIEIKPKCFTSNDINKVKYEYAIKKYGNQYKIITEEDIKFCNVDKLYYMTINNEIVFDTNCNDKFVKYCKRHLKS